MRLGARKVTLSNEHATSYTNKLNYMVFSLFVGKYLPDGAIVLYCTMGLIHIRKDLVWMNPLYNTVNKLTHQVGISPGSSICSSSTDLNDDSQI